MSSSVRAGAVSRIPPKAAGDAHTRVPSTTRTASAKARAVSVPGDVRSMSGIDDAMPSAGPSTAHGAKAATSASDDVMP